MIIVIRWAKLEIAPENREPWYLCNQPGMVALQDSNFLDTQFQLHGSMTGTAGSSSGRLILWIETMSLLHRGGREFGHSYRDERPVYLQSPIISNQPQLSLQSTEMRVPETVPATSVRKLPAGS